MKSSKDGNLLRLIAIFLVAVTLVLTVGFAADGWQSNTDDKNNQNNNKDDPTPEVIPPPVLVVPDYLSYITGLEITKEESESNQICYILDSMEALHGISASKLTVEIPTENGASRLVAYIDENVTVLPKIGSITKTRDYISNIASFFGGFMIYCGNDDIVEYSSIDASDSQINLLGHVGYYYTEQDKNVYTNKNLVEALMLSQGVSSPKNMATSIPFDFIGYYDEAIKSNESAKSITVSYSKDNTTKFSYSIDGEYTVSKNGTHIVDSKSGKFTSYENVFVLFADATTYEKMDGMETVLDTNGSGVGYYFTEGTKYNIRWYCDDTGSLVFLNDSGTKLMVNRGKSYIAYAKSTMYSNLLIEP